jgi:DNA-binding transcriptional regulator YiaG
MKSTNGLGTQHWSFVRFRQQMVTTKAASATVIVSFRRGVRSCQNAGSYSRSKHRQSRHDGASRQPHGYTKCANPRNFGIQACPRVTPKELIRVREYLHMSRAVFAIHLRTKVRTLENLEQRRAKPRAQATLLIKFDEEFPDTVDRLGSV